MAERNDRNPARRIVGADAVLFDREGRILLQCRSDFRKWGLPGGSVEVGETVEQAVLREVKEETGYDAELVRLVGVYSDPGFTTTRYPSGDVVHDVSLAFECRITGGTPRMDAESTDMRWFGPDELPADLLDDHRPHVRDAFARQHATFVR